MTGPARYGRSTKKIAGDPRGDDAAGFGHAVTGGGSRGFHADVDLLYEIGLQLRAAAAERQHARCVRVREIRMREQFARHHRHATHARHAFAFDQLQRFARIPAVHQHHRATRGCRQVGSAIVRRDVEQRRCDQGDGDGRRQVGIKKDAGAALCRERANLCGEHQVHKV